MRFGLALRELEQVERAFDVDLMRRHRRELGARRQQRRQVIDRVDFELRQDAIEKPRVGDRAGELALHQCAPATASSGFRSSVTIESRPLATSCSMSPWPISPPAPVMSTTGLRIPPGV